MAPAPHASPAAERLSLLIAGLMALASASGLLTPRLYRDNAFVAAAWVGNDLVTLAVATPLLAVSLRAARAGSLRGRLVWLGLLDYVVYNYAFYLFAAAFNAHFLLYVALFTLSGFALIFGLAALDARAFARAFDRGTPVRLVSALLMLVAGGLGGFHVAVAGAAAMSNETPAIVTAVGHPTNVIAALDLSLVVPVGVLAAIWLRRGHPWGYVLAVITTTKGAVYMLALSAATLAGVRAGVVADASAVGLWGGTGVACLVAALAMLSHVDAQRSERRG